MSEIFEDETVTVSVDKSLAACAICSNCPLTSACSVAAFTFAATLASISSFVLCLLAWNFKDAMKYPPYVKLRI